MKNSPIIYKYDKRELKIAKKMLSLMKKIGMIFNKDEDLDAIREIMEAWYDVVCLNFCEASSSYVDYEGMGQLLEKKYKWYMNMTECMQMMVCHHVAVALIKK